MFTPVTEQPPSTEQGRKSGGFLPTKKETQVEQDLRLATNTDPGTLGNVTVGKHFKA